MTSGDYERVGEILVGSLEAFDTDEDIVSTIVAALQAVARYVISASA